MPFYLKGCPRCHGDLTLAETGWPGEHELSCLQCGYRADADRFLAIRRELVAGHVRPAAAPGRPARRVRTAA